MTLIEQIDKHKSLYGYLVIAAYLFIDNTINASSVWMEHNRNGEPLISLWEPFAWEYTSAFSTLILLPIIFYFFNQQPPRLTKIKSQLLTHLAASITFSLAHVVLMVLFREWIYYLTGGDYNFGPWLREIWYEYRKDAWGYVFFFMTYHMVQYIYIRLKGEASPIAENEEQANILVADIPPKHFLVKKLDKEFLVSVADIEWIESSGNYVNLYSKERIYPLRSTLANITERLETVGFSRIHRSHTINHSQIDNISYQTSGDGDILLKSGRSLKLSRRYKDALKANLTN